MYFFGSDNRIMPSHPRRIARISVALLLGITIVVIQLTPPAPARAQGEAPQSTSSIPDQSVSSSDTGSGAIIATGDASSQLSVTNAANMNSVTADPADQSGVSRNLGQSSDTINPEASSGTGAGFASEGTTTPSVPASDAASISSAGTGAASCARSAGEMPVRRGFRLLAHGYDCVC